MTFTPTSADATTTRPARTDAAGSTPSRAAIHAVTAIPTARPATSSVPHVGTSTSVHGIRRRIGHMASAREGDGVRDAAVRVADRDRVARLDDLSGLLALESRRRARWIRLGLVGRAVNEHFCA